MMAILSDSLGLTSEGTSARSIHIVGELVEQGVSIPAIENMRRQMQRKSPELVKYKSSLLNRIQYSDDQRIAYIVIPWEEIEKYSHEYNPSMLVLDEMRMVNDVCLAIAYKTYPDGRITAKLRANYGSGVASSVASHFGGGGHPYAAGFKLTDKRNLNDVIKELISVASEQLDNLKSQDTDDKPTQYAYTVS